MALISDDRVFETTTTTGAGALTLAGAAVGFKPFSAACSIGDTCYYSIEAVDGSGVPTGDWETGLGTYSAANTLTRTTPQKSSNANAAVTFATGTKRVYISTTAAALAALAGGGGGGGGGAAVYPSARYWRIRSTRLFTGHHTDGLGLVLVQFIDASGTNLTASGTAGYASNTDSTGTWAVNDAFNGTTTTGHGWYSGGSTYGGWLAYDFGSAVSIRSIKVAPLTTYPWSIGDTNVIEYSSDNIVWQVAGDWRMTAGADSTQQTFAVPPLAVAASAGTTTPVIKASNLATYSAASIAVPFPGTPAVGDLAIVWAENGYTNPTYPAGWTVIENLNSTNYTNGVCVAKTLNASDIATGSCTIGWSGSFDGVYGVLIVDGTTVGGVRDVRSFSTPGSNSYATLQTNDSYLAQASDLPVLFAASRANGALTASNFTALHAGVATTNATGFLGKYSGALGKLGLTETISMSVGNNGIYYALIVISGPTVTATATSAPWYLASAPSAASMTLTSGDATNLTLTDDASAGLLFDAGAPVAGDKFRLAERTIAAPAADWTFTARIDMLVPNTNYSGCGISVRDTVSGKLIFYSYNQGLQVVVDRYAAIGGSFNAEPIAGIGLRPTWFRAKFAASSATMSFYASMDGKVWTLLGTETVAAYLGNNPNRVGFGVAYNRTSGPNLVGSVGYLTLTAP